MENLQSMFENFDKETIHSILVMHKGAIQPTIEDLLKLSNEQEEEPEDNMFSNDNPTHGDDNFLNPDLIDAETNEIYARKLQEKEDMRLAMSLQQAYIARDQRIHNAARANGDGEEFEEQEQPQGVKPRGYKQFSDEPGNGKGKKVGINKEPVDENQEVITFNLDDDANKDGYTFHQIQEGEEIKNNGVNGLNNQFEEMKVNDDENFNTSKKPIQKKKGFFERLFSKDPKKAKN